MCYKLTALQVREIECHLSQFRSRLMFYTLSTYYIYHFLISLYLLLYFTFSYNVRPTSCPIRIAVSISVIPTTSSTDSPTATTLSLVLQLFYPATVIFSSGRSCLSSLYFALLQRLYPATPICVGNFSSQTTVFPYHYFPSPGCRNSPLPRPYPRALHPLTHLQWSSLSSPTNQPEDPRSVQALCNVLTPQWCSLSPRLTHPYV